MPYPLDELKLSRVRELMTRDDLDALVVRAPDNIVYLTNYWCMKGYDIAVFPREGEATLIAIEPQEDDARRTAWTQDIRLFKSYDDRDPRPPTFRSLDVALQVLKERSLTGKIGLELSQGTQSADRMVGEPTTWTQPWFNAFNPVAREVVDASAMLAEARAIKTDQEIERMKLANELAALAMEHTFERIRPGMKESEVAAMFEGFVHSTGIGFKGKVEMARAFTLVWSGKGIRTFTATGSRPVQEHEPTLFEIWVCVDGYWNDLTKNLCPGELTPEYHKLLDLLLKVFHRGRGLRERWRQPARPGSPDPRRHCRRRLSRPAVASYMPRCGSSRPRASLCPSGGHWHDPQRHGAGHRAWNLLARRRRPAPGRQFLDHRRWQREAVLLP